MDWEKRVVGWANDRNLVFGSDPVRQHGKLMEESDELLDAIQTHDRIAMKDAIGDMSVVLCIIAAQIGESYEACLEHAWEQIKDRTGRMVDGVFVKDQ